MSGELPYKHGLFRKNAIKQLSTLEELHFNLKVTTPSAWIWILATLLMLISILAWGFWGTVNLSIDGSGILLPSAQIGEAEQTIQDNIQNRSEKVQQLESLYARKLALYQKHYLIQEDLIKAKTDYMTAKEELSDPNKNVYDNFSAASQIHFANSRNTTLDSLVFISNTQGKRILPGMHTYILPNTLSVYEYGYIEGIVISISPYPISKQLAYSYLGNINLVDEFFANGAPFLARVRLQTSKQTSSQLAWTTKSGPSFSIQPGTIVTAKMIYSVSSPIHLLTEKMP